MRAIKARDEFLARVARKLDEQVAHTCSLAANLDSDPDEKNAALRAALEDVVSLTRELRIIAIPDEPVPMQAAKELDLIALVVRLFEDNRERSAKSNIAIDIQRSTSASIVGHFDEHHLTTMLFELTSNALKYSANEPVTVTFRLSTESERMMALLIVENHGQWVGDQRTTFTRFERGELRDDVPGFGIGLWLTQRLAEAHGGSLRISSSEHHTRAIITLPIDRHHGSLSDLVIRLVKTKEPHVDQ